MKTCFIARYLLGAIFLVGIYRTPQAMADAPAIPVFTQATADDLLRAFGDRVQTLSVRYRAEDIRSDIQTDPYEVTAKIDLIHGYVNSTGVDAVAKLAGGPRVTTWVKGEQKQWLAYPEYAPEQKGTWTVQVFDLKPSFHPELNALALDQLRDAMVPFRFTPEIAAQTPAGSKISFLEQKTTGDSQCALTFAANIDDKNVGRGIYTFDFSDGIKWLGTVSRISGLLPWTNETRTCDQYKKINGVWIPMRFDEVRFSAPGKQREDIRITIESCEVNPHFTADDFIYVPPFASKVHDMITGQTYRQGYKNPTGRLGSESPSTQPDAQKN